MIRRKNLVALRQALNGVEAEIVEATSGDQALAATLDNRFALAILDIMMPDMNGFELAEYLRGDEESKTLPIIFLTASYEDELHMFKGYDVGAIDYIVKPCMPELLLRKVKAFLDLDFHKRELERHRDHLEDLVADANGSTPGASQGD